MSTTVSFDWSACVNAITSDHLFNLAAERGYRNGILAWLRQQRLLGLYKGNVAFPVHDEFQAAIGCHYRTSSGQWFYTTGTRTRPLIIGDISNAKLAHAFESQWDAFAFCDATHAHLTDGVAVIVTRGAENGAGVAGLLPSDCVLFAWPQNDPESKRNSKTGKTPAEKWLGDVAKSVGMKTHAVLTPPERKDPNDWYRAGATSEDFLEAIQNAKVVPRGGTEGIAAMSERIDTPGSAPSPVLIELATTLDRTVAFITEYVVFPTRGAPTLIALWVAHAHAIEGAESFSPYLHIQSPEKRCGKSRVLDCLEMLVPNPWLTITPSEAVLYRRISAGRVTLLLDEVDAVFTGGRGDESKEGLRAILNAGFERGKKVPRCTGHNHEVQDFEVFCAKALAGIGKLPTTIADRSIPIRLVRRTRNEVVRKFRKREAQSAALVIRDMLEVWAAAPQTIAALLSARPEIPDALGDRQADISEPLLAIADLAGGDWPVKAREALLEVLTGKDADDESNGVLLLGAMREIFHALNTDRVSTEQALRTLVERDDGPWAVWWGNDVDAEKLRGPQSKLAKMLRPYDIVPSSIRLPDGSTPKGYKAESFADAWARYLPPV